jgi:hypothetical protein
MTIPVRLMRLLSAAELWRQLLQRTPSVRHLAGGRLPIMKIGENGGFTPIFTDFYFGDMLRLT